MLPMMDASEDVEQTIQEDVDNRVLMVENEKSQEELANMLRLLIANFCDEHFIRYLRKTNSNSTTANFDSSNDNPDVKLNEKNSENGIPEEVSQKEVKTDMQCDEPAVVVGSNNDIDELKSKNIDEKEENKDSTNSETFLEEKKIMNKKQHQYDDIIDSPPGSSSSASSVSISTTSSCSESNPLKDSKVVSSSSPSSLTPPPSSSFFSSSSSSSASDTLMHIENSESVAASSTNPITPTSNKDSSIKSTESLKESDNKDVSLNPAETPTSSIINNVIDKLEIIDCATKSIKEIASSAERNHHRLHHLQLRQQQQLQQIDENCNLDELSSSSSTTSTSTSSSTSKLWSTILIGADKLEIFGSIHVRSNNVRLLSCLIDEQLTIDVNKQVNFSSASSSVSSDSSCGVGLVGLSAAKNILQKKNRLEALKNKFLFNKSKLASKLENKPANGTKIKNFNSQKNDSQTRNNHYIKRNFSHYNHYPTIYKMNHRRSNCCQQQRYYDNEGFDMLLGSRNSNRAKSYHQNDQNKLSENSQEDIESYEQDISDYMDGNGNHRNNYYDYEPEDEDCLKHRHDYAHNYKRRHVKNSDVKKLKEKAQLEQKTDNDDLKLKEKGDKIEENIEPSSEIELNTDSSLNNNNMIYPIKKFKAYHHYCNNKRKMIEQQELQKKTSPKNDETDKNDKNGDINDKNDNNLSNLANVAAAAADAMRISAAFSTPLSPNETNSSPDDVTKVTTKKSRKSSINKVQQVRLNESVIDYDEQIDDDIINGTENNITAIPASISTNENKLRNEYDSYLYDEEEVNYDEEAEDDNSSLISYGGGGTSYYANDRLLFKHQSKKIVANNDLDEDEDDLLDEDELQQQENRSSRRRIRKQQQQRRRSNSRCSSVLSGAAVSSRSISMNGGVNVNPIINSSRSPSSFCRNNRKYKTSVIKQRSLQTGEANSSNKTAKSSNANGKHRSVSPASSLASSQFSNDYEDYDEDEEKGAAYRSYSSSSSFKSDFEVDYQSERRNHHHHHHHHHGNNTKDLANLNNRTEKSIVIDDASEELIEENLNKTDLELDDEIETDSIADKQLGQHDFIKKCKNELNTVHHVQQNHHRRKQHLIDDSLMNQNIDIKQLKNEKSDQFTRNSSKSPPQTQSQHQLQLIQEQQQIDERKREDEYLIRKYKYNRRFAPYNNNQQQNIDNTSTNHLETSNTNLYLLASSRQHHRLNSNYSSTNSDHLNGNIPNKEMSIDRLSPISDPDLESPNNGNHNSQNSNNEHGTNSSNKMQHQINNNANNNNETTNNDASILNRINNLSPSSSSSSSSSSKTNNLHLQQQQLQHSSGLNSNSHQNGTPLSHLFHHSLQQQQLPNTAATVLAAAAAAAAAAANNGNPNNLLHHHHHHLSHSQASQQQSIQNHHHHAQSVAALLADMQHQQSQQQQDVAKALAASLSNGNSHHHHLNNSSNNNHHSHAAQQLLSRFSSNAANQNELMAAVLAQQQQQQQHRSLLESHHHGNNNHHNHNGNNYNAAAVNALNANGQLYSRYSSHINAAVAAAAAAAASSAVAAVAAHSSSSHNRRANSVESDATPSPPATTPASAIINGVSSGANGQLMSGSSSLSSSSSSSSTSSDNYTNPKYNIHDRNEDMCSGNKISSKERSSSVGNMSSSNDNNNGNSNGNEKVRLVPGYDVFISTNDLNACNDDRGSATRLLRNLMDVFFDKSTLAKSSINGTGRITNTLDKHVISALFAYVKNRYVEVPHSQLTRAATDKCVQTRRNFRKKIKAAQSYFGMFPSM